MKKIRIHGDYMQQMAKEFDCSIQTVRMSLYYVFNSDKSKEIRKRAKELLQKEVAAIIEE
ncbi:MAG: hypothetical protein J0G96_07350 [Flavobacteriia bacterium]|nr:hypothetical protein [Flavobacteriia bacterium]OJX37176.1 MAG: hypothetical protein BGO87_12860 [Flavobacteriia bacterium 40-80]